MFRSIAVIALAIRFGHPEVTEADATRYAAALQIEAQREDYDPLTGVAIIHHESRFHARAISHDTEDYGLAQVRARYVGACQKDKDPLRHPSAACRAVKQQLLEPEENIRVMSELITKHRKLCKQKAGSSEVHRWLASYQGRNSIKENRWCDPGEGTWSVIEYRDRLVREVAKHAQELDAPRSAPDQGTSVADLRVPPRAEPPAERADEPREPRGG